MTQSSFPQYLSLISDLFPNTRQRKEFVTSIVDKLKAWTGCECVGIRIVNQDDYMPYEAYVGFSHEFWEHENWLSLREHQCGCIRVVNGTPIEMDRPILTEKLSLFTNDLQGFGRSVPADLVHMYRGKCIECGFGSLALIPIRKQSEVIGLIHLADARTNMLSSVMIQTLEALTVPIAEVIDRISAEDRLQQERINNESFVYTVSHDLKAPTITIQTFLSFLRKDLCAQNWDRVDKDLEHVQAATEKIKQLTDALLQLARVGYSEQCNESVLLQSLIEETTMILAGAIHQNNIRISIPETSLNLCGDRLKLAQIWQNLTENAIKYMGDQPQPQIEFGSLQRGNSLIFFVRDNGMGIAEKHRLRIFSLFTQLDKTIEGTGLGLALVKRIVEIYGGTIWVESAGANQGSCFCFTLPQALVQT